MLTLGRKLYIILVTSLLLIGGLVNQSQQACNDSTGVIQRNDYYAPSIETRMYYSIYLPPCYESFDQPLPAIYLMHGSNEDDGQWIRLGLKEQLDEKITSGTWPPVIVVLPFANWIGNQNRFGHDSWNTVFMDQFLPLVEESYAIDSSRRAIGGISRGGFWAFQLAFLYPEMFQAVGGHSAYFDEYHAPPEFNPLDLALNAPGIERLRISLDRGADDYARPGLELMNENLNKRGVLHTYEIYPQGQHNNTYWGSHIEDYMMFYLRDWQVGGTSDVVTPTPVMGSGVFVTNTPHPSPESDLGILPTSETSRPIAQVAPTVEPTLVGEGWYLVVPVVVFPSRLVSIDSAKLRDLRRGILDAKLVLTSDMSATLRNEFGLEISPQTRVVEPNELYNILNRDRTLYTLLPFDQLTPRYRILHVDETHPLDGDLDSYPFAFETENVNYEPVRLTRIAFSGVTALARQTIPALDENGLEWAASGILEYVTRPDFFHTSNEVSFYPDCPEYARERLGPFCSKESHFELFNLLDLDIVELSGNHNNDYGYDAYLKTLEWYHTNGILTIAGGETVEDAQRPLIIEHHGNRIALLSCNLAGPYYAWASEDPNALGGIRPGAADCRDSDWLRETLGQLAEENDVVVLSLQHIEFDQFTPSPQQRVDFRTYASWGADVVLGTQSHFPQVFEFLPGKVPGEETLAHYGLGNLYFDQEFYGGMRFFIDQLFIYDDRLLTVDLFTGMIEDQGRPRPMTPDERENFLYLIFTQYGDM